MATGAADGCERFTIHDLAARLIAVQACLAAAVAPWYAVYGLHIDWRSASLLPVAHAALIAAWLYCRRRYSTHPRKSIYADVILATLVLLLVTNIASPAQYLAIALHRPLIDDWLTGADAALGIDVGALAAWTRAHPVVSVVLSACYASLIVQFLMPLLIIGLRDRDRTRLWEYVFHFNFCLIVTIVTLAIFPAECPYTYLGFTPTIDQTRVIAHISALRAGTFHTIDFGNLDGLVSMPSFHAAGAIMVTWAFRRHRSLFAILALVNAGLIAATFMSGVHYFVDIVGAFALFGVSLAAFRLVSRGEGFTLVTNDATEALRHGGLEVSPGTYVLSCLRASVVDVRDEQNEARRMGPVTDDALAVGPSDAAAPAWAPLRWPRAARPSPD